MQPQPDIAKTILATALERGKEKSTCPSEIARLLFPMDWRKHMTEVREVAIGLQYQGKVLITQKGLPIDTQRSRVRYGSRLHKELFCRFEPALSEAFLFDWESFKTDQRYLWEVHEVDLGDSGAGRIGR